MQELQIKSHRVHRRRLGPMLDFSGFFAFFGVSGIDHSRSERMNRRFEQEYFANILTLVLSRSLEPGRYQFLGLPAEVNRRGWKVTGGNLAVSNLSDDALAEFQAWRSGGHSRVTAQPLT